MTWADGVYSAWAVVVVLGVALWGVSASGRTVAGYRIARPGTAIRRLTCRHALRAVVVLAWMWVGWHLFAR